MGAISSRAGVQTGGGRAGTGASSSGHGCGTQATLRRLLAHLLSRAAGSLLLFQYTCLLSSKRIVCLLLLYRAQFAPAQITRTTAEPRPNAYIPDDIGIPKPYGNYCAIVAQLCSEAWFRLCSPLCWVWVRRCFGTIQTVGVGSRVVTHESTNDQACGNMKSPLRNLVITHVCSRRVHA